MAVDVSTRERSTLRRHLADAVSSETESEAHLRLFASQGDDEEVQSTFATHADTTATQVRVLRDRYLSLFGDTEPPEGSSELTHFPSPHLGGPGNAIIREERILQDLLLAYTAATGEIAMYEALASLSIASSDQETEMLARTLQNEERSAADKLWHFLSSRSKIAFNMLTVSEVDPAVETKIADDRITS